MPGPLTELAIGDDCAIVHIERPSNLLLTTDMLMDGRHFRLQEDGPERVGFKALAVNLSDIAAMAGVPRAALVAIALPQAAAGDVAQGIYAGLAPLADRFAVDLIGGDTNAWDGPLVISVTVIGETTPRGAVCRSGAKPGDVVLVTGPLGGSLHSGRHLHPEPRVAEALAIHESAPLHAMIDISDGLAADLSHILSESGGLGAVLDETAIPVHADAQTQSLADGAPALEHAALRRRGFRALPGAFSPRRRAAAGRAAAWHHAVSRRRNHRGARTLAPVRSRLDTTDPATRF